MEAERSTRPGYELIVASGRGVAIRAPLVKQITSVGSAPAADLGVAALPPHWATVHRRGDAVEVHHLASGQRITLGAGQVIELEGYTVGLVAVGETLALDQLAERLAAADGPAEALTTIVDGVIAVAGADLGAVILAERGGFTVAVARDADGHCEVALPETGSSRHRLARGTGEADHAALLVTAQLQFLDDLRRHFGRLKAKTHQIADAAGGTHPGQVVRHRVGVQEQIIREQRLDAVDQTLGGAQGAPDTGIQALVALTGEVLDSACFFTGTGIDDVPLHDRGPLLQIGECEPPFRETGDPSSSRRLDGLHAGQLG